MSADQISEAEERRIIAEFQFEEARRALERKRMKKRPFQNIGLLFQASLFLVGVVGWAYTKDSSWISLVLAMGSSLFINVLSMFAQLCDDTREIKEILSQK